MKASRLALPAWIVLAFTAAIVGSQFGPGEWYRNLNKPAWNPPSWVFAPVWSFLYLTIGVSAWGVWTERGVSRVHVVWGIQLVLNALWSCLFFGLQRPDLALVDILLLNAAITGTIIGFWRVKTWTGAILIPYQAWVLFATALN